MIASLDLVGSRPGSAQAGLARLLVARRSFGGDFGRVLLPIRLRSIPWPVPRPTSYGFFAIWPDPETLRHFRSRAFPERPTAERLALDLRPVQSFGNWCGRDPLAGTGGEAVEGPLLLLTHSRTRPSGLVPFLRADRPVVRSLVGPGGPLWADGFMDGVATLDTGTLSLWRDARTMTEWAYANGVHREAVAREREGGWFAEAWFARFAILSAAGAWRGFDGRALAR